MGHFSLSLIVSSSLPIWISSLATNESVLALCIAIWSISNTYTIHHLLYWNSFFFSFQHWTSLSEKREASSIGSIYALPRVSQASWTYWRFTSVFFYLSLVSVGFISLIPSESRSERWELDGGPTLFRSAVRNAVGCEELIIIYPRVCFTWNLLCFSFLKWYEQSNKWEPIL